jgi:hypothetical protein
VTRKGEFGWHKIPPKKCQKIPSGLKRKRECVSIEILIS